MSKLVADEMKMKYYCLFILKTKVAGNCPKLGGTADKHFRPCQIDDRGDFL